MRSVGQVVDRRIRVESIFKGERFSVPQGGVEEMTHAFMQLLELSGYKLLFRSVSPDSV